MPGAVRITLRSRSHVEGTRKRTSAPGGSFRSSKLKRRRVRQSARNGDSASFTGGSGAPRGVRSTRATSRPMMHSLVAVPVHRAAENTAFEHWISVVVVCKL